MNERFPHYIFGSSEKKLMESCCSVQLELWRKFREKIHSEPNFSKRTKMRKVFEGMYDSLKRCFAQHACKLWIDIDNGF